MSDAALRANVVAALRAKDTLAVREIGDGVVEVAHGEDVKTFPFKQTVSRGLLGNLSRWYGVPMAAFFPPEKP